MSAADQPRVVEGTVTYEASGRPAEGMVVLLKDADLLFDDPIGADTTDEDGQYRIEYGPDDFHDLGFDELDRSFEGAPDVYLEVRDRSGAELGSTEDDVVLAETGPAATVDLELPGSGPPGRPTREHDRPPRRSEEDVDGSDPNVDPVPDSDIIGFVKFDVENPVVGESVSVTPVLEDAAPGEETMVAINGVPGAAQTLQFTEPGRKLINVTAFRMVDGTTRTVDHRTVDVDVGEGVDAPSPDSFRPILRARQVADDGTTVELTVENAEAYAADNPSFRWAIDGDRHVVTAAPRLRYDFADDLPDGSPYATFDVTVQAVAEGWPDSERTTRTVSVWNRDYLDRMGGVLELGVQGEPELVRDGDRYAVTYELQNPGPTTVYIDARQVEFLLTDEASADPLAAPEDVSFSVPANGSVSREFSIPVEETPDGMFGVGLHVYGWTEPDLEVFGNVYAEVQRDHPLAEPIVDPVLADALGNVYAETAGRELEPSVSVPELIGEADRGAEECPSAVDAGTHRGTDLTKAEILDRLPEASMVTDPAAERVESDGGVIPEEIPDPANATEGDRCHPAQDAPDDDLACRRTSEFDDVYIPGRILNARSGDVILSPGSGSIITGLMMQVDPMEVYTHSGIVTADHVRIRHSTESFDWLVEQRSPLFDAEALTYGWPGTVTQSVDEAYYGSEFEAPGGDTEYTISTFSNELANTSNMGVVHPEVVKPDPRIEHRLVDLRPTLEDVAASAADFDGHYRVSEYSEARADSAIATTGGWFTKDTWWDETRPTVCSTFIWGAIKQLDDPPLLEAESEPLADSDLEHDDTGAEVGPETTDGLYHYDRAERTAAAEWLHSQVKTMAKNRAGPFEGAIGAIAAIPHKLANQVTNAFAHDLTGVDDDTNVSTARTKERWEEPGAGNTVSPDTIREYWDAPAMRNGELQGLYGHSERLVYRAGETERRRVYRWERTRPEEATLDVTVVFGGDDVAGATVEVGGEDDLTDGSGSASLTLRPGSYRIHAHKNHDIAGHEWYLSKEVAVDLDPGESASKTITLEKPDAMFRDVEVSGTMELLDENWPARDVKKTFTLGTKRATLEPVGGDTPGADRKTARLHWSRSVNDEVRGELEIELECQPDGDVKAEFTSELYEGKSADTDDREEKSSTSAVIDKRANVAFHNHMKGHEAITDEPEIWIDGTIRNRQSRS